MAKTLTLRLDDKQEKLLNKIKLITCETTSSKSILSALNDYSEFRDLFIDRCEKVKELQNEIDHLRSIIENARTSAFALGEAVGQSDLLEDIKWELS